MSHKKNPPRSKARKGPAKDPAPAPKAAPRPAKGAPSAKANAVEAAKPALPKSSSNKTPPAKAAAAPRANASTTKAHATNPPVTKASAKSASTSKGASSPQHAPEKSGSSAPKASAARAPEPLPPLPRPPEAAATKPPLKVKPGERPPLDALRGQPTDEIWVYYRAAVAERPRDEKWLEQLRNVLMELHLPLVKHIAERLLQTLPKSIELDDLVSAGLFGLMDSIRGFDPDRGIKFKTYCTTRIRGSILDQLRSQDWVPRLVRLKAGRIEKALQRLQGEYGREPTHAELAQALEMEHGELSVEMSSAHAKTMFSLSERWDDRDDDNPMEKVEIVEDKNAIDPIGELNRRDLMLYITKSLTHKERFIIEQYYQVGHTMREIGEMLALTESRVCQIHSNVMSRLKSLLSPKSTSLET
jgi:RNA polymerase sigma factor FliA